MICDEAVLQNLADAGCSDELVARYRSLSDAALSEDALNRRQEGMLRAYRRELLERLHEEQRRLDCLDYLLYRLRQDAGEP